MDCVGTGLPPGYVALPEKTATSTSHGSCGRMLTNTCQLRRNGISLAIAACVRRPGWRPTKSAFLVAVARQTLSFPCHAQLFSTEIPCWRQLAGLPVGSNAHIVVGSKCDTDERYYLRVNASPSVSVCATIGVIGTWDRTRST